MPDNGSENTKSKWPLYRFLIITSIFILVFVLFKNKEMMKPLPADLRDRPRSFDGHTDLLNNTTVTPVLNTPIEQGKNIIWCSSFQLAWNKLSSDILKAPVKFTTPSNIADKLNQKNNAEKDLLPDSYYSTAGFVSDGIVEKIETEMAEKFSSEQHFDFNNITDELSDQAIIAYAFLTANVRFKIPYFENDQPFIFTDSNGDQTPVASFGIMPETDLTSPSLQKQVDVIYTSYSEEDYDQLDEFIIDPCKKSKPYQLILAKVNPKDTLADTVKFVEDKIKKRSRPSILLSFTDQEELLVPNMLWKLIHNFKNLEGLDLANPDFEDYYIDAALQMIEFRLDRSGAGVTSESLIAADAIPNKYLFNEPFLIYMKLRGRDNPFFVMWIDNAELLTPFPIDP